MGQNSATDGADGVFSADSPMSNDGDNSISSSTGGLALKKGPWTSAEDAILIEYVKKHGEGNWNAVQKHSGLLRCGKSCRLRWANHLRPNLKKGAFTPEEERLIIELHAKMGNKWARMAAHLPGRTDNEIKNYWNTRIKRRQRAGLPLYPPELCAPANPDNQNEHHSPGIYFRDSVCQEIMQSNFYETLDPVFDNFNKLSYTPEFTNISVDLMTRVGSSYVSKTVGFQKRTQEPDELMSDYGADISGASSFGRTQTENYENEMSPFGLCYPHDPNLAEKLLPFAVNQDRDVMSSVTFSASKHHAGVQKLELPSLQYHEAGLGIWDSAPKSSDYLIHTHHSRPLPPLYSPPCSDGLLEDLVYESKVLSKFESGSSHQPNSFKITPGDITPCTEFNDYVDPSSPSGNSMGSIFSGCRLTGTSGCTLELQMPVHRVKSEVFAESWIMGDESNDTLNHFNYTRPDALLGSCWVDQTAGIYEKRDSIADTIAALLGEDSENQLKNNSASASTWALSSCTWNNSTSAVHQMPDLS